MQVTEKTSDKTTQNDAMRIAIDDELTSLYERIALLKAKRNSIAPIFSLPPEVLVQVFSEVSEGQPLTGFFVPLTKLMLVCQHWYDVILSSQALWSNMAGPQISGRTLSARLTRSGSASLKIKIMPFNSPTFAPLILANANRLRYLDLHGTIFHVLDFMHKMCDFEFPLLQWLILTPDPTLVQEEASSMNARLPRELLEGRMPRLRGLALSRIDAPLRSLPPLLSLSLRAPATLLALDELLALLQSSPDLHTLKLDMVVAPGAPARPQPVALPHLELLHLRDLVKQCEDLLTNIIFPPTTRLKLFPQGVANGATIRDILVPVRKHVRARGAPIPLTLVLEAPPAGKSLWIAIYAEAFSNVGFEHKALVLITSHPASAHAQRQIITKVLKAFPQTITHLDASEASLTIRTWKSVCALLPALKQATVSTNNPLLLGDWAPTA
ncbi:hypothetical protein B0H19DRAFT_1088082 [Mycena capillaripes]|nr:hypothetical protein B0H19DRAFT_1088082 [Mycena capillaripes]